MQHSLASLYPLTFLAATALLGSWLYFQHRHSARRAAAAQTGFVVAFVVYLFSVLLAEATLANKFGVLSRDLLVMGTAGLLIRSLLARRKVFALGAALLAAGLTGLYYAAFPTVHPTRFQATSGIELDENAELLIELAEGKTTAHLGRILQRYNLTLERAFYPEKADQTNLDNYYTVNIPSNRIRQIGKIARTLYRSGAVVWIEENEVITIAPIEGTKLPPVKNKFGINDPDLEKLWGFEAMRIDDLYDYLNRQKIKPKRKVLIAILDTGVDRQHEDLKDNFQSTQSKYDNDPVGHGTHCAGIAGAVSNNGVGIASFSTDNAYIRLTSIKVLSASGSGTQQSIIKGMIEAADRGADVLSMSLGGYSDRFKIKAYTDAVKYVSKAGGIVVAAAGNSNRNAKDFSPVNTPGVIGVSAIDQDLNKAIFSNTVTDIKLGVAAPGVGIYSTIPSNKYNTFNGTSMATPYVAGLVGLLKSLQPMLTAEQAYEILNATGKDTKETVQTGKLIQPAAAVRRLVEAK